MLRKIYKKLCDIEREIKELKVTVEATTPEDMPEELDITSLKEGIELRYKN